MRLLIPTTLILLALVGSASAECYADYKAKQDNPLRLHYGVAEITGNCSRASAQAQLATRLRNSGWTLLSTLSVFGADGLQKRRQSAGAYFLRFPPGPSE